MLINIKALFLTFILFSHIACSNYRAAIPDNRTGAIYFKIDDKKLTKAFKIVADYELAMHDSAHYHKCVLQGVEMAEIIQDVRTMLNNPNSTLLGNTGNYCGVSAILNWLLNNEADKYAKAVLDLADKGKASFKNGSKIKVPRKLAHKINYTVSDTLNSRLVRSDIETTSLSDFLLGVSLLKSEKCIQRIGLISPKAFYKKTSTWNFIFANTPPWEIDDLFRKLGVSINKKGVYKSNKKELELLKAIGRAVKENKMPLLYDNHLISYVQRRSRLYQLIGAHYFTIHHFKIDSVKNTVDYSYWDYGKVKNNPYQSGDIKPWIGRNISHTIKLKK